MSDLQKYPALSVKQLFSKEIILYFSIEIGEMRNEIISRQIEYIIDSTDTISGYHRLLQ